MNVKALLQLKVEEAHLPTTAKDDKIELLVLIIK